MITPTVSSAAAPHLNPRRALMIAFHYPPYQGSSGVLRTWNFSRYLPESNWTPYVLTATAGAYESVSYAESGMNIPTNTHVTRAFARDAARLLSIRGRYPGWVARPDRWYLTWYVSAVWNALALIRRHKLDLIWSTYPICSAHAIAKAVKQLTGLPWIADFRDSMTEVGYPADTRLRAAYQRVERQTIECADQVVFTTPGTQAMYTQRYGDPARQKFTIIANGYDEDSFLGAEQRVRRAAAANRPALLLHSGVIYPSERDPRPFLRAVGQLKRSARINAQSLCVLLRATGHDDQIASWIAAEDVGDIVQLRGTVPYSEALAEMLDADGLLLFQAANSNHQVPAKLYEYLRAGRPILALTSAAGDTAAIMRGAGLNAIAELHDASDIERAMMQFLSDLKTGSAALPDAGVVRHYSRRAQAQELAQLMSAIAQR